MTHRTLRRIACWAAQLLLILFVISENSLAAETFMAQDAKWVTNGTGVKCLREIDDILYIGGDFNYIGPPTGCAVLLDPATGKIQEDVEILQDLKSISVCIEDGKGGFFVVAGPSHSGSILHVLNSGIVDPKFQAYAPGYVSALALYGQRLYVGGTFTSIGGLSPQGFAILDASTGNVLNIGARIYNEEDRFITFALSDGVLYVGGKFSTINGYPRKNIAALDAATGIPTEWNPGADQFVNCLVAHGNDIIACGAFKKIGGKSIPYLAFIDRTSGVVKNLAMNPDGGVGNLVEYKGILYANGGFTQIGGIPRPGLAAIDLLTGSVTSWAPDSSAFYGENFAVCNDKLFIMRTKQQNSFFTAIDVNNASSISWEIPLYYSLNVMFPYNSKLFIGGDSGSIGGKRRKNLAAINTVTGEITDWDPQADNWVSNLYPGENSIYACGSFTKIANTARQNFAEIDLSTGNATNLKVAISPSIFNLQALLRVGNTVYLGGTFTGIQGTPRPYLAAVDAVTGQLLAWNPKPNNAVLALAESNGILYLGGAFTQIVNANHTRLAAFQLRTGRIMPLNANIPNGQVNAISLKDEALYLAGSFDSINNQHQEYLAAVNRNTGESLPWTPKSYGDIYDITASESSIYIWGQYRHAKEDSGIIYRSFDCVALDVLTGKTCIQDFGITNSYCLFSSDNRLAAYTSTDYALSPSMGLYLFSKPTLKPVFHSADTSHDCVISPVELSRVIGFYTAGGYHADERTEDGFAPGEGAGKAVGHSSDYAPQDGQISLRELSRLIAFYNAGGYVVNESTEDGFAPVGTDAD